MPILLQPYKVAVHIAHPVTLLLLRWQLDVSDPRLRHCCCRLQTDDVTSDTGGVAALRHLYLLAC